MSGEASDVSTYSRLTFDDSRKELTATGIAPESHRTSLLIPLEAGTKYAANVMVRAILLN